MSTIILEKFAISIFGVCIYKSKLHDNTVWHYIFGLPVWFSHSPCSVLWHKADANKDFDTHTIDSQITELALSLPFAPPQSSKPSKNRIAYLITELYETGGHSKLVRDSILLLDGICEQQMFFTRLFTAKKYAGDLFKLAKSKAPLFGIDAAWTLLNTKAAFKKCVLRLTTELIKYNPATLFIYTHPNDIRGAAICALLKKHSNCKIIFYPHASHRPNIGITIADRVISPLPIISKRYTNDIHLSNIYESRSMLLSCLSNTTPQKNKQENQKIRSELGIPPGCLCTMSGATSFKFFEPDGSSKYFIMIKKLLERNPNLYHVIITNLTPSQNATINNIFSDATCKKRLININLRTDYQRFFSVADVFVDSFPMSSALTMVELMRLQVPYVVKINTTEPLLSFHEYQKDDFEYMYSNETDMLIGIEALLRNPTAQARSIKENLAFFQETYSANACRNALLKLIQ